MISDIMSVTFSIITVTLNAGDELRYTAESLSNQTCRDFEHIIKDGGSTDNSMESCCDGTLSYNPIIITYKDNGIYDAMNQALSYSTGKYVLFLNAGDRLVDSKLLETLLPYFSGDSTPDLIYTDYISRESNQRVVSPAVLSSFFLFRTMLCHQVCFVRRDNYSRYGKFDTTLKVVADYDFLLRLMYKTHAVAHYVPIISTEYMGGGFSANDKNFACALLETRMLRRRYFSWPLRMLYGGIYALTFPSVRIQLIRNPKLTGFKRLYTECINLIYCLQLRHKK